MRGLGNCWHCSKKLYFTKRRKSDGPGAWHIDHYPIPFADIEDQCCCGITNQKDIHNLVPACVECNLSHRRENDHIRWYHCGRSQSWCGSRSGWLRFIGDCQWCGIRVIGFPIIISLCLLLLLLCIIVFYYISILGVRE